MEMDKPDRGSEECVTCYEGTVKHIYPYSKNFCLDSSERWEPIEPDDLEKPEALQQALCL